MKTNKSYLLIAAVLTILFTLPPTKTLAQENIVDRLDKTLGVKLPSDYETKVREFTTTNNVLIDKNASQFTELFIVEQMKDNWGISMQNQLLFVWAAIYKQITNKNLYNGSDGNKERLNEFKLAMDRWKQCQEKYKEGFHAYMQKITAEARQQTAEARQQTAEARQQSIDKGLEALAEIINYFDKYITSFNDMINLDGVTQTLANFNQEKNSLLKKAEKLRSEQQSNQQPSATEAEKLKKTEEQQLSDITKQRTDVVKQIYTIIEKNIPEIEKLINSTAQNNGEAQQYLDKAKQRFAEALKAIADSKLTSAEQKLMTTMALLMSAEAKRQTAEARREAKNQIFISLDQLIRFYNLYNNNPSSIKPDELKDFKDFSIETINNCKEYDINYKAIFLKGLGDDKKLKDFLKFYEIE